MGGRRSQGRTGRSVCRRAHRVDRSHRRIAGRRPGRREDQVLPRPWRRRSGSPRRRTRRARLTRPRASGSRRRSPPATGRSSTRRRTSRCSSADSSRSARSDGGRRSRHRRARVLHADRARARCRRRSGDAARSRRGLHRDRRVSRRPAPKSKPLCRTCPPSASAEVRNGYGNILACLGDVDGAKKAWQAVVDAGADERQGHLRRQHPRIGRALGGARRPSRPRNCT